MTFSPAPKPQPKPPREKKRVPRKPVRQGPPRVRDRAYLDWIKSGDCLLWGRVGFGACAWVAGRFGTEPAHVKTKGSGGADRGNVIPLCPLHHDEQEGDTEGFEEVYGVNLKLEAAKLLVKYVEEGEPGAP